MPNRTSPNRQKTLNHPDFGPITIRQSNRYRRLALRISPKSGITLTAPLFLSESTLTDFISKHTQWIRKHLQTLTINRQPDILLKPGDVLKTRSHSITLQPVMTDRLSVERTPDGFCLEYPFYLDHTDGTIQKAVRAVMIECWREEAGSLLPARLRALAEQTGLSFGKVTIRNTKTRWGSCSPRNDISLSLHLLRLPDYLIDYVLIHELAHTKEKNHRKPFWTLLEQLLPGARQLDRELNKYRLEYY